MLTSLRLLWRTIFSQFVWIQARSDKFKFIEIFILLVGFLLPQTTYAQTETADAAREKLREKYFISGVDNRVLSMWVNASYRQPMLVRKNPKHGGLSWREREVSQNVRFFGLEPEGTINVQVTLNKIPDCFWTNEYETERNYFEQLTRRLSLEVLVGRYAQSEISSGLTSFSNGSGFDEDLKLEFYSVFFPSKSGFSDYPVKFTEWERSHCYNAETVVRFVDKEKAAAELERRSKDK